MWRSCGEPGGDLEGATHEQAYSCYCLVVAELTRRLQVLLDEPRWTRLERRAQQQGTSVATLVRHAIDLAFPDSESAAAQAAAAFLARDPIDLGEWESAKASIQEAMLREAQA